MSIPKIIHYCWFGGKELPEKVSKCIDSWKKFCPDYEIIQWNESNYDINSNQYTRDAYKEKKWAFVADYARLDIVYKYGGIYLDTDVELIKSLDDLLEYSCYMGIEKNSLGINTGLGYGAEQNNKVVGDLIEIYKSTSFYNSDNTINLKSCVRYTSEYFQNYGYNYEDKLQVLNGATILSSEYLCPVNFENGKINITPNTVSIHWYDSSWYSHSDKKIHGTEVKIKQIFPEKIAVILCKLYRNSYRLVEYTAKGILIEKIKRKFKW